MKDNSTLQKILLSNRYWSWKVFRLTAAVST